TRLQGDWSSDVCSSDLNVTTCPFCSDLFLTRLGMKLHLETEYHEGERYVEKQRKFIDIVKGFNDKTGGALPVNPIDMMHKGYQRSEERRVGKERRTRW